MSDTEPKIKLSCKCKTKIISASDCPEWPWLNKDYFCMDCMEQVFFEEIATDADAEGVLPQS